MAKRAFDFPSTIRVATWDRQKKLCALCGVKLEQLISSDNCHHVIPDHVGDPTKLPAATQQFMASMGNAVVLCDPCHRKYAHHEGRTKYGAIPFFGHYRYSHGDPVPPAHSTWLVQLRAHAAKVWKKYVPHPEDFPLAPQTAAAISRRLRELKEEHYEHLMG